MIDDRLIVQLTSPDANRRKQAVMALAKSKDPAALPHLAKVFRTDTEPEIRELARKAGLYIKQHSQPDDSQADDPAPSSNVYASMMDGEPAPPVTEEQVYVAIPTKKEVSPADEKRAQGFVQQAFDLHMRKEDQRAAELLARAFTLNPRLTEDKYSTGLAVSITGLAGEEAVHHLLVSSQQKEAKKKSGGGRAEPRSERDITWADASIDLAIYGVAVGGLTGLVWLVLLQLVLIPARLIEGDTREAFAGPSFTEFIAGAGVATIVIGAVVLAIVSVIFLLIQYAAIHIAAVRMFDGQGTLRLLIRKLTLFATLTYPASYAGGFVGAVATIANPDLANTVSVITLIFSLGVLLFIGYRVGQTYQFGTVKGCGALIVGTVLMIAGMFACVCTSSFLLTSMVLSSVR